MGSNRRYEASLDQLAHSDHHPPISLTEKEHGATNQTLRRCDPPIAVRAWVHFRDGEKDRVWDIPAVAEAYTSRAVFVRFRHPIGHADTTCWVWANAVVREKPRSLS